MAAGVAVRAAAPGRVRGVRDGMADIATRDPDAPEIAGRECGNGVVLAHAGGWTTQYCHLAEGSIAVRPGETVAAGQPLGRIGLSGATEYPHLHFTVRDAEGLVVDPFDARRMTHRCELPERESLWADPAALPYRPGGALAAGILDRLPDYAEVKAGIETPSPGREAPALVFWAHFFGLRAGDAIVLTLRGPDGALLAEDRHRIDRVRAQQFRAAGRRARGAWPPGIYRGEGRLIRGDAEIARIGAEVTIP